MGNLECAVTSMCAPSEESEQTRERKRRREVERERERKREEERERERKREEERGREEERKKGRENKPALTLPPPDSDIDWSRSIVEIDRQLYAKYGLTDDEIAFIENTIKPME